MIKSNMFNKTIDGKRCIKLAKDIGNGSKARAEFLKKHKLTIASFQIIELCLRELWNDGETETISSEAMNVFKKYGFTINSQGVGWNIS